MNLDMVARKGQKFTCSFDDEKNVYTAEYFFGADGKPYEKVSQILDTGYKDRICVHIKETGGVADITETTVVKR